MEKRYITERAKDATLAAARTSEGNHVTTEVNMQALDITATSVHLLNNNTNQKETTAELNLRRPRSATWSQVVVKNKPQRVTSQNTASQSHLAVQAQLKGSGPSLLLALEL